MGDECAELIAKLIAANKKITRLSLSNKFSFMILGSNIIGDKGAHKIGEALEVNSSMLELVLGT